MRLITAITTGLSLTLCASLAMAAGPKEVRKGNVTLTTSLSNTHVLTPSDGKIHVAIDLKATEAKAGTERLPLNVSLVIDRSGSMRGDKMDSTKKAAAHFVKGLTDRDTLAIVSYSDDVRVDLPASIVTKEVKKDALVAIERIRASGSTNLSGGLFRGQEEVQRNIKNGQVNRVLLMSDGLANRGVTDQKALSAQVQKSSQQGLSVTTMGVGTDYNEDLMTAVADNAGGNYYFIEKESRIAAVFTTELSRMSATVAQGVEVELFLEDGVDLDMVHGYTFTREGDRVKIPLAEMFGAQKRSILVTVKVPTHRAGKAILGAITLKYDDVLSENERRTAKVDLDVMVTKDAALVKNHSNKAVEERVEEVQVAAVMTRAADLLKDGRSHEARKLLRTQMATTSGRARGVGGSARMEQQVKQLKKLDADFADMEAAGPDAPAPAAKVKDMKAKARMQTR